MRQRHGRLTGAARRQVDRFVKQLQRAGGGHDGGQQNRRLEQGDRQVDELLQRGGTVNTGRLIDRVINVLQAGQIEHHVVARPAPDQRNDDDPARRPCVLEPIHCGDAHGGQHPVDKAIVGKQRLEDHGVGNQRGCTRQEDHGAVDALALQIGAVEQLRQNQRQNQHDGHLNHKVKYRVEQALLEGGVL